MEDLNRADWLQRFRDAVVIPLSNTDPAKWPIRSGRVGKLVLDLLVKEFFDDLGALSAAGWSKSKLAELFGNPSRLWRFAHHLVQGLRAGGATFQEQRQAVLLILELIAETKSGSPFCENGANLLLGGAEIGKIADQLDTVPAGADQRVVRTLHRASGTLWSLAESLYFVAHEMGVEIHGPYVTEDGQYLLIRDFFRPSPKELWPELDEFPTFDLIRIAVSYDPFDGWLDVYNNLYLGTSFSLPAHARRFAIWKDGERMETAQLAVDCRDAVEVIQRITALVDSWQLDEIVRRYVDVFWWRKRELAITARGDWRPPRSALDRLANATIPPSSSRNPSVEELRMEFDLTL
jgi:hypothetical protein